MALTESAGAAYASASAATKASGSFTPTANGLLVVPASCGNGGNGAWTSLAISDSVSGTWTQLIIELTTTGPGVGVWCKDAGSSPSAQTVTVTATGGPSDVNLIVRQFAGAKPAAQQNGVTAGTPSVQTGKTLSITPGTTGSQVVGAYGFSTSSIALTANGSTTIYGQFNGSGADTAAVFEANALSTATVALTLGFTNAASGSNAFALAEILPAAAALTELPLCVIQAVKRAAYY